MNDDELKEKLAEVPLPDQQAAEERAWDVVRAAYENELETEAVERGRAERKGMADSWPVLVSVPPRLRSWGFFVALLAGMVLITPARALVVNWVERAIHGPKAESISATVSPPGGGRLLVQGLGGTWVTAENGSRRLLGDFDDSVWSPRGRFVAAVDHHQLVALKPDGKARWALSRPSRVSLPSWNEPDGFRIAYIEGRQLRIVAGDGTADSPLARGVAAVRPAWRPGSTYDLAFVRPEGKVQVIRSSTGERLFAYPAGTRVEGLEWSEDGSRLLVWSKRSVSILDTRGRPVWRYTPKQSGRIEAAALRPGRRLQLIFLERGSQNRVVLTGPRHPRSVVLAAGGLADPIWSPDGTSLMVAWPEADQWLFLRGPKLGRVDALSEISSQFAPGKTGQEPFPEATGWCCSR